MPPDDHRAPSNGEWARVFGSVDLTRAEGGDDVVHYGSTDRDVLPAPCRRTGGPDSIETLIHW